MKKKFVYGSIIVTLLILVNPLMISQTVKADDPPNVAIAGIWCDSTPVDKNTIEWFKAQLSNQEYYNVTVMVEWFFDGTFLIREENIVVPAGGNIYVENMSYEWPGDTDEHNVSINLSYNGEVIDTAWLVLKARKWKFFTFDSYVSEGPAEVWETNPSYMTDLSVNNYASSTINGDVELLDDNTCGENESGTIKSVWIRAKAYYSNNKRVLILRPVFGGSLDGSNYEFTDISTTAAWSPWFNITDDERAPEEWNWYDVDNLDCDVEVKTNGMSQFTLYCSQVEIRVCHT